MHKEYARSIRGKQVVCDVKGNKYQRVSMIAAQSGKSILAPFVFQGTADTKLFEGWVEKCLLPELNPGNVIIMDNYIIHKSKKTQVLIEDVGCKILFLPPYSPDLNPIENYWAVIKSRIKKLKNTCDDFQKAIDLAFQQNY